MKNASPLSYSTVGKQAQAPAITGLMQRALAEPDLLSLAAGFTDNTTLPAQAIGAITQKLQGASTGNEHLQYGANAGRTQLREITTERLKQLDGQGVCQTEKTFISNGSQQALYLAIQSLCDPGDCIVVEQPTYFVFLEMLTALGVEPIPLPGNGWGHLDCGSLPDFVQSLPRERVKGIYLNSYFANPTSTSLSLKEKTALAKAFQQADWYLPVLEDAAYRELHFGEPEPCPSILALPEYAPFPKLYTGTYTKTFATGLKVGFGVCSNADWRERMLAIKGSQDFGTSNFSQAIIEQALAEGYFDKHLTQLHHHYAEKASLMGEALEGSGMREQGWQWKTPRGGLYFWMRGPEGLDTSMESDFCANCLREQVLVVPGDLCLPGVAYSPWIRVSFGAIAQKDIPEAIRRLAVAAIESK